MNYVRLRTQGMLYENYKILKFFDRNELLRDKQVRFIIKTSF